MIASIPPLPFSLNDSEKTGVTPVVSRGLTTPFIDLLQQNLGRLSGGQKALPTASYAALQLKAPVVPVVPTPDHSQNPRVDEAGMKDIFRIVFKHEGKAYVARDGVESSKYGILDSTATRLGYKGNVKNMSAQEAEAIYRKLWAESGAARLPRDLALVHFDTYVNSPSAARKMLNASAGNADTYLDLRSERYARLSHRRPQRFARYMNGWMSRIDNLRSRVSTGENNSSAKAFA